MPMQGQNSQGKYSHSRTNQALPSGLREKVELSFLDTKPLCHKRGALLLVETQANSLTFSQEQANFILGHSLRSIYQDLLAAPMPEHLNALVDRLEEKYPL
jgi:hypothetical protein